MPVCACFIDVDGTITDDGDEPQIAPGPPLSNALFGVLLDVMEQGGWSREKAADALDAHASARVFWDYGQFVREFNLPARHAWSEMTRWHDEHLVVYADAVAMVKELHDIGLPLGINRCQAQQVLAFDEGTLFFAEHSFTPDGSG